MPAIVERVVLCVRDAGRGGECVCLVPSWVIYLGTRGVGRGAAVADVLPELLSDQLGLACDLDGMYVYVCAGDVEDKICVL